MTPREILEEYKSAPISTKTVEDGKIKIVYPIDTALASLKKVVGAIVA